MRRSLKSQRIGPGSSQNFGPAFRPATVGVNEGAADNYPETGHGQPIELGRGESNRAVSWRCPDDARNVTG